MKKAGIILVVVALVVAGLGIGAFVGLNPKSDFSTVSPSASSSGAPQTQEPSPSVTPSQPAPSVSVEGFSGSVVAGSLSKTPYIRYNKADFEKARGEGRAIYIYVYATWCPICAAERPNILAAFNELNSPNAVGFETHWIDGQDNDEDHNLQRTFGVAQQHTHIFLKKDGNVAEKIFTPISKDEIKSKILNIA